MVELLDVDAGVPPEQDHPVNPYPDDGVAVIVALVPFVYIPDPVTEPPVPDVKVNVTLFWATVVPKSSVYLQTKR